LTTGLEAGRRFIVRAIAPERRTPDIEFGRSATDVLLANPVRSGRKQP